MASLHPLAAAEPRVIELWPEGVPGLRADAGPEVVADGRVSNVHQPTLTWYPAPRETDTGLVVVVCPGGGYTRVSIANEAIGAARWLNSIGVSAFVLKYRLQEYGHPAPLRDVLRAMRLVRSRAAEFGVDPQRLGLLGASAGAHLAATAGLFHDAPEGRTGAEIDAVDARPAFLILQYPVITMQDPFVHAGSRRALLGPSPEPHLVERLSLHLQVRKDTPPTFIVHTQEDASVPVENALLFYRALRDAGVPVEMHLYEKGPHGFGFRADLGPASQWPQRCEAWLRFHGWLSR